MRETTTLDEQLAPDAAAFVACLATVLEVPAEHVPAVTGEEPTASWTLMRWLGGRGLGLVPVADPAEFSWAGPWIARVASSDEEAPRAVVMYGVPSGVAFDPTGATDAAKWRIADGYVVAGLDVARAAPRREAAPVGAGTIEAIAVATAAGAPTAEREEVEAIAGHGLDGDRHLTGSGTFPSGVSGSALTLIEAEVCESFDPPLTPNEHRRNLVTRGIALNGLVGVEFAIGRVRCRGMRLCEPCRVVDGYSERPILRPLVHRGGLRADIVEGGPIRVGDSVRALEPTGR